MASKALQDLAQAYFCCLFSNSPSPQANFFLQLTYTKLVPTWWPLHQPTLLPGVLFPRIHSRLPPSGHLGHSSVTTSLMPLLPLESQHLITAPDHSTLLYCLHSMCHYLKLPS